MRATVALIFIPLLLQDNLVREKYDSGRVRLEYRTDNKGQKHGSYTAYYESGKKKIAATYFHGEPDGPWDEYTEAEKIFLRKKYAKGVLQEITRLDPGYQVTFKAGIVSLQLSGSAVPEPVFPRSPREIREKVAELEGTPWNPKQPRFDETPSLAPPHKAGRLKDDYLADGLRHLVTYRWLSELATDVVLDPACTDFAQHGAVILGVLKELTHTPKQPADMEKDFFDKAYKGTSSSNIAAGARGLRGAVEMFMHDSDPSNIRGIGHRRWILNPRMKKTGFGEVEGGWVCQWSTDSSAEVTRPDCVRYPARGYFPVEYLSSTAAWHVTLNTDKFRVPEKGVQVRLWTLTDEYDLSKEIRLDHFNVNGGTVIFRPVLGKAREGMRVLVSISGVKQGKADAPVLYIVELFSLKNGG